MKSICGALALFLLTGALLAGCKKSSDKKSNTDLITQTSWKFSNAKVGGLDVSSSLDACETDNILSFSSAGTGTVDEGPTKCNAADPQTNPFTWSFATNETVLHISTVLFSGGTSDFNIVTLNATNLVLSQDITISGFTQTAVVTFIH